MGSLNPDKEPPERPPFPTVFELQNEMPVDGIFNDTDTNKKRPYLDVPDSYSDSDSEEKENPTKMHRPNTNTPPPPPGTGGGLFSWLTGGSNNSSVVKRNRNGKTRHVRFKDSNNGGGKNKTRKVREWRW